MSKTIEVEIEDGDVKEPFKFVGEDGRDSYLLCLRHFEKKRLLEGRQRLYFRRTWYNRIDEGDEKRVYVSN